jgi:hypothetical protein
MVAAGSIPDLKTDQSQSFAHKNKMGTLSQGRRGDRTDHKKTEGHHAKLVTIPDGAHHRNRRRDDQNQSY